MCGINGLFAYAEGAGPVDRAELALSRDAMAARGPDGAGDWISPDGRVGFGHRRLAIIDLRAIADQPMHDATGRLSLVFNGEIYNYRELRAELGSQGHVFATESDTEVLLHLYRRYGREMVGRLRGMYAFALYDDEKGGMLLARDPFGIKPLYYADDGKCLRLASQVKALVAGGAIDRAPEPAGHVGFFLWGHVPDPFTLYRNIRALPAGTTLWVDRGGVGAVTPFFHLHDALSAAPAGADGGRREQLHAALVDSIRHHLIADVGVGLFLSAGLDSATIAALATEGGAGNLNSVTLGFREFARTENDETGLAERLAAERGTRHRTEWVTAAEFAVERERLMAAMDQPSIDGVNTYFVARAARATGLKVALSGLGGDELFGGYPSFRDLPRMVRWLRPLARINGVGQALRRLSAPLVSRFTSPKYAGLFEYGGDYAGAYLLRRALFMPWELPQILPPEVAAEGLAKLQPLLALRETIDGLERDRPLVSALELGHYMRDQLLRDSDWAGMAHGVEIRVPFVDVKLLADLAPYLAASQPPTKAEMASTPEQPLPAAVLQRRKTGFVVPVRQWLMGETGKGERGLRSWAREVWRAQGGAEAFA